MLNPFRQGRFTLLFSFFLTVVFNISADCIYTFSQAVHPGMILIRGGSYRMGSNEGMPEEKPVHEAAVHDFWLDSNDVTVADFRKFIRETNYKTDAEKFGSAAVFNLKEKKWELVNGATWQFPMGPEVEKAPDNYPVTQVSWNDAMAYCKWSGKRLPTEEEWEYAARGGKNTANKFAWGNSLVMNGKYMANVWEGSFPDTNTNADGFQYSSPVGYFGRNPLGLSDMGGNVWQWTLSIYHGYNSTESKDSTEKVIRGGSFLCCTNYCYGYRVSSRMWTSQETSMMHIGFRCALTAR